MPADHGLPAPHHVDAERDIESRANDDETKPARLQTMHRDRSEIDDSIPRKTYVQRLALLNTTAGRWSTFSKHSYLPFIILFTFPAITYTAITYGSLLAWFSIAVNVYSVYFTLPPYNFGASGIGLMNLPPFIGGLVGSIYGGLVTVRSIIWLSRRNSGIFEPEMRLWTALSGVVIMPLSLLMFGLSTAYGLHWIYSSDWAWPLWIWVCGTG